MLINRNRIKLTLEGARAMMAAAMARARALGVDMDVAIVDDGGHLVAFERMDGAKVTSIDVAIGKAFTAACTRMPTQNYQSIAGPGGPAFGLHVSNHGKFMIVGGGLPIVVDGQTIGGIGASSGSVEQDIEVSQAGLDALYAAIKA